MTVLLVALSSFTAFAATTYTYKVSHPAATYTITTDSKKADSQKAALTAMTDTTQGTTTYYLYANGSTKGVIASTSANNSGTLVWYVDYANHGYANYVGTIEVKVQSTCEDPFTIRGVFDANYR